MVGEHVRAARASGEAWAEGKADILRGDIPAVEWPDVWRREWTGDLSLLTQGLDERARLALYDEAHHAAVERWGELVLDQRDLEDVVDEELADEASAIKLVETLRGDLPDGLFVDHDGPRVFLQDKLTGEELTVVSLKDAWRVVDEWKESRPDWATAAGA